MDYAMPRADNLPSFALSPRDAVHAQPAGVKGCGEAGAIGAPAAISNAIVDALKDYGVRHVEMPATPEKLWRAIHQHQMAAE
jgi:carbon-monoxide dehydrogenase large subunit